MQTPMIERTVTVGKEWEVRVVEVPKNIELEVPFTAKLQIINSSDQKLKGRISASMEKGEPRLALSMHSSIETSVTIVIRLVRTFHRHSEVFGLVFSEFRKLDAEVREMQAGHFLVQLLGQYVNLFLVLAFVLPQCELRKNLIGE